MAMTLAKLLDLQFRCCKLMTLSPREWSDHHHHHHHHHHHSIKYPFILLHGRTSRSRRQLQLSNKLVAVLPPQRLCQCQCHHARAGRAGPAGFLFCNLKAVLIHTVPIYYTTDVLNQLFFVSNWTEFSWDMDPLGARNRAERLHWLLWQLLLTLRADREEGPDFKAAPSAEGDNEQRRLGWVWWQPPLQPL